MALRCVAVIPVGEEAENTRVVDLGHIRKSQLYLALPVFECNHFL